MKKVLFLFLACLPLLFAACDEKEEEEIVFVEGNHTEHTFRLEGEALNKFNGINSDPALYGIEVLYADGTPYAYGLFDELSKAKVKLLNEQEFVFRTMIVRKGKEMCHSTSGNKYGDIFLLTNDGKAGTYCQLLNQFTYNRKTHFLHFRNPRQSFYFDAFTGYRPNLSDRTEKEIEIDTRTIAAKISISASGNNFGKIEFRLMSDVGEPVDRPFNEFSTPIFILTPEKNH